MNESRIGVYRIIRKLGEGGMGAVFEALHEQIERRVAIKVLHPAFARNPEATSRFFNEARAVNRVDHLGLVQVSDYGRLVDGTAYIVMELLKGETLGSRLKRLGGSMSVAETVQLARQVADALAAAHEKGIVHRDLKPDNVMIIPDSAMPGGERTKLLDFGIAKLAETADKAQLQTGTNALLGTPAYMSPEQCRGAGSVDDKSDVYSLGVMLYVMLTGRQPFTGAGTGELLAKHIYEEPPLLATIAPWVPTSLTELVHRLLAKDKQQRPAMRQVVAALDLLAGRQAPQSWRSISTRLLVRPPARAQNALLDRPSTLGLSAAQSDQPASTQRRRPAGVLRAARVAALAALVYLPQAPQPVPTMAAMMQLAAIPAAKTPPKKVRWSVRSQPTGAEITLLADGLTLGKTPWLVEREPSAGELTVSLRLAGYQERTLRINLAADADVEATLAVVPAELPRSSRQHRRSPEEAGFVISKRGTLPKGKATGIDFKPL